MKKNILRVLSFFVLLLTAFLISGCLEVGAKLTFVSFPKSVYTQDELKIDLATVKIKVESSSLNGEFNLATAQKEHGFIIEGDSWDGAFSGSKTLVVSFEGATLAYSYEVVKKNIEPGTIDIDIEFEGQGTQENPYKISSEEELRGLAAIVNNKGLSDAQSNKVTKLYGAGGLSNKGENTFDKNIHFEGKYFLQTADITLHGAWDPIGEGARKVDYSKETLCFFAGHYDGGNFEISGLSNIGYNPEYAARDYSTSSNVMVSDGYVFGLFGLVYNATFKNINLTNVQIEEDLVVIGKDKTIRNFILDTCGGIAAFTLTDEGRIQFKADVEFKGVLSQVKTTESNHLPGDYSHNYTHIDNCHVKSGYIHGYDAIGGIFGRGYAHLEIRNCSNAAEITSGRIIGGAKAGGIFGFISTGCQDSVFDNLTNSGRVIGGSLNSNVGYAGALGYTQNNGKINISNCINNGEVYFKVNGKNELKLCNALLMCNGDNKVNATTFKNNTTIVGSNLVVDSSGNNLIVK